MHILYKLLFILVCTIPAYAQAQEACWTPYLMRDELPNAVNYLPVPPKVDTPDFDRDKTRYQWGKSVRNTERGKQAISDANYHLTYLAAYFSEAFGHEISFENCPEIYTIFVRTIETSKQAVHKAKKYYVRKRPYVQYNEETAVPEHEEFNRTTGSFPSGHTSMAWSAALILTELNPERGDELLKRGYEYGESRVIVGYHYQSDVDAGRLAASAAVAAMHADESFMRQLNKAKKEFKRINK